MKMMNRRDFFSIAVMLVSAPILKASPTSKPKPKTVAPKFGRISVSPELCSRRIKSGDWTIEIDGEKCPKEHFIQTADDIEGWYDYLCDPTGYGHSVEQANGEYVIRRRHCNVTCIYHGTDPQFSQFKKPTI